MRDDIRMGYVRRVCGGCLLGCLLAAARPVPAAEDKPAEVRFADDFAADSRKDYRIEGEVAWRKGALLLGQKAAVERRLPLGFTAEVRATVGWSAEEGDREVVLAVAGDDKSVAGVALKQAGGKVKLVVAGRSPREVSLGEVGARGWQVRLDVGYGLVRARAWRRGDKEPAEWQVIRQAANADFQPGATEIRSPTGGISLEEWQVRGVGTWRPDAGAARDLVRAADLLGRAMRFYGERKYQEARPLLEEALAIDRKTLPPLHPGLALSLNNVGDLMADMGKYREVLPLLEEALAIHRKNFPPHSPRVAFSLTNLARLLRAMGRYEEARRLHEEVLAIDRKTLPPMHRNLAAALNNLGMVLYEMDRLSEARPLLEEALAIDRKVLHPEHPRLALTLNFLGRLLLAMGKYAEARPLLEESLAINRKVLPPLHPRLAASIGDLGLLLWEMGRTDEAFALLDEAATTRSGQDNLAVAATAQRDHAALLARSRFRLHVLLSAAVQAPGDNGDRPRRTLAALLDGKAVSGAALRTRRTLLAGLDATARGEVQRLLALQQQLADMLLRGPDPRDPGRYRADCEDLRRRGDALEAELARRVKTVAEQRFAARARPADLAGLLADASALVEVVKYRSSS
jgi:tetratricopeptide (TPR) repeat protein